MNRIRKNAAIMFTDIQGWTAIMQRDEAQGIRLRDRHRKIFEKANKRHNGQIIQYFGDGTLSIFDDAQSAVCCAIELQQGFGCAPHIPVRIGIHWGSIVLDEFDIIGDAVNIASHLERLAQPGSILVTREMVEFIPTICNFSLVHLGLVQLKNDNRAREVFAVRAEGVQTPRAEEIPARMNGRKSKSGRIRKGLSLFGRNISLILW